MILARLQTRVQLNVLVLVAIAAASSVASAQESQPAVARPTPTVGETLLLAETSKQQSKVIVILGHLRDDELTRALKAIGEAADLAAATSSISSDLAPAVAALNRSLAQLSSDEQYELLRKWTMPSADRESVRVVASLVPEVAPPQVFARALGERPKKTSFPVSSIGNVDGLFCSAWTLVVAAEDAGTLRQLTTELEKLATDKVANAGFVLALAKLKDTRIAADKFGEDVLRSTTSSQTTIPSDYADAVLVAAALEREDMGQQCEREADRLNGLEFPKGVQPGPVVPFLRRLRANVILKNKAPETSAAELFYSAPNLWVSSAWQRRDTEATGADRPIWVSHEDHIKKLAGPGDDFLFFRYPLTGKFELKCELANLDHGGGGLGYGGLAFDAKRDTFRLTKVGRTNFKTRIWPFVAAKNQRMFNRVNVRSDGKDVLFLSNLHPGWSGKVQECESFPWLSLRAFGRGRAVFRNLEIVGEPVIPREIWLSNSSDLRGWAASYRESLPKVTGKTQNEENAEDANSRSTEWDIANGTISTQPSASLQIDAASTSIRQSHLVYMRPMLNDETVAYEFFYEPGKTVVHPAVGRLAFLMEPKGIRAHWLTNNAIEWTGLSPDNAVLEPLNRRGPAVLPLKAGGWNAVTVKRSGGKLSVSLNGTEVYLRQMEETNYADTHFGFYLDRNKSTARIRNVVLSGPWPEKLDAADLTNLVSIEATK